MADQQTSGTERTALQASRKRRRDNDNADRSLQKQFITEWNDSVARTDWSEYKKQRYTVPPVRKRGTKRGHKRDAASIALIDEWTEMGVLNEVCAMMILLQNSR